MNTVIEPINEAIIKKLEKAKGLIWQAKGDILLTAAGYRPSTFIYLEGPVYSTTGSPLPVNAKSIDGLKKILDSLNLKYETRDRILDESNGPSTAVMLVDFFVARTTELAQALHESLESGNDKAIGTALGYPETAVQAFLTPNMLEWEDYPESTEAVSSSNMLLLGHRLSKDNWRNEVEYLEQSGNYLKSISPTIYDELTR